MLLLRQLTTATTPLTRFTTFSRFYVKKASKKMSFNEGKDGKQVHQETLRHIDPCARINIKSDIYLKVRSADVHDYPDGDVFIAELHGGHVSNSTASMKVHVSEDEKQVDVVLARLADKTDFHCELEVPIRATIQIDTMDGASVMNMHCDQVCVKALKNINTKEINAESISLSSEQGKIRCEGRLLGQDISVETKGQGSIFLDKLLGDKLSCTTQGGDVSTNSCYVSTSKFETDSGCLQLKNVHNKAEVWTQTGDLQMTGVHGNLNVRSNGGRINLQLSELTGESAIVASGVSKATLNISEEIEKSTRIEVTATGGIELDTSLSHLDNCLGDDKKAFRLAQQSKSNRLKVFVEGSGLKFGKLSWADAVRAAMAAAGVD